MLPDFDHIHKELLRNGVSKKLLWTEYMEDCRAKGKEPLMYSQFCYHIHQNEQKRRATMHISRKPGEANPYTGNSHKTHGITKGADYYMR